VRGGGVKGGSRPLDDPGWTGEVGSAALLTVGSERGGGDEMDSGTGGGGSASEEGDLGKLEE